MFKQSWGFGGWVAKCTKVGRAYCTWTWCTFRACRHTFLWIVQYSLIRSLANWITLKILHDQKFMKIVIPFAITWSDIFYKVCWGLFAKWLQGIGCRIDFVIDPGGCTIHAGTRDFLFKVLDLHKNTEIYQINLTFTAFFKKFIYKFIIMGFDLWRH